MSALAESEAGRKDREINAVSPWHGGMRLLKTKTPLQHFHLARSGRRTKEVTAQACGKEGGARLLETPLQLFHLARSGLQRHSRRTKEVPAQACGKEGGARSLETLLRLLHWARSATAKSRQEGKVQSEGRGLDVYCTADLSAQPAPQKHLSVWRICRRSVAQHHLERPDV